MGNISNEKPVTRKKRKSIRRRLEKYITQGEYTPGDRIPDRSVLQRIFGVSRTTIQGAMDHLIEDGFVKAIRGQGTFVSAYPPHLCRYGLLFAVNNTRTYAIPASHFYQRLCQEADQIQQERDDVCFRIYAGLQTHEGQDYERLISDVHNHRLAGLLFVFMDPQVFVGTPIADEPGIARAAYWPKETEVPGVTVFQDDDKAIVDRGLDYLISRGRRRVGFLLGTGDYELVGRYAETAAAERGMIFKRCWLQNPPLDPDLGGRCVSLLMSGPPEDRPDGLICLSKNFNESIIAGFFDAHIRVPQDVEVVTNCFFPTADKNIIPMRYLGYHMRDYMDMFLKIVEEQGEGKFQSMVFVKPKFEEDFKSNLI